MKYLGSITDDKDLVTKEYVDNIKDMIADEYSGSSTYSVGDYCTHNGNLYRCTTAITTAEAWNNLHWTQVQLGDDVSNVKSAFDNELVSVLYDTSPIVGQYFRSDTGAVGNLSTYCRTAIRSINDRYTGVLIDNSLYKIKLSFYDETGDNTGAGYIGSTDVVSGVIYIPAEFNGEVVKKFGTSITKTDGTDITNEDVEALLPYLYLLRSTDITFELRNKAADSEATGKRFNNAEIKLYSLTSNEVITLPFEIAGSGSINYATGNVATTTGISYTDYIDVSIYARLLYKRINNSAYSTVGMAFYDENKYYLNGRVCGKTSEELIYDVNYVNVPANAKYARFSVILDTETYGDFEVSGEPIIKTLINHLNDAITNNDGITPIAWQGRGYINTYANPVNLTPVEKNTGYLYAVVNCNPGEIFTVSGSGATVVRAWAFLDADNNVISKEKASVTVVNKQIVAPDNAVTLALAGLYTHRNYRGELFANKYVIPNYYYESGYLKERTAKVVQQAGVCGLHGTQFVWITDMHLYENSINNPLNGLQSAKLLNHILANTGVNRVFFGGDTMSGNTMPKTTAQYLLSKFVNYLSIVPGCELYSIIGNHEYNNPGATQAQEVNQLTASEIYGTLCKNPGIESLSVNGDYWFDDTVQKIRFFCITCGRGATIPSTTISWFNGEVANTPDGYTIVVLSHTGLDSDNNLIYGMQSIVNTLDTIVANNTNVNVACVICGHVHRDAVANDREGKFPIIAVTCDRAATSSTANPAKTIRALGTIGEQAFDVVQIDTSERKVYLTRIGGNTTNAVYDSETGKIYDSTVGDGVEYTGAEWVRYTPYKDRVYNY